MFSINSVSSTVAETGVGVGSGVAGIDARIGGGRIVRRAGEVLGRGDGQQGENDQDLNREQITDDKRQQLQKIWEIFNLLNKICKYYILKKKQGL